MIGRRTFTGTVSWPHSSPHWASRSATAQDKGELVYDAEDGRSFPALMSRA
jgi:hypothetical protein